MSDDKPKSLKDFLETGNSSGEKSLDEILNADAEDKRREQKASKAATTADRRKFIIGGVAAAVLIGGGLFINPWTGVLSGDGSIKQVPKLKTVQTSDGGDTKVETPWYLKDDEAAIPVDLPDWATESTPLDASKITEEQIEYIEDELANTPLKAVSESVLLPESTGITSDPSKAQDKNGFPNLDYSYVTSDVFVRETGIITERLLNPLFGGWGHYQFADQNARTELDPNIFSPIFTEKYRKENFNKKDKSYLPIYADWAGNNYGMGDRLLPAGNARWIGKIKSANVEFEYSKKTLSYSADAVYNVVFTAKTMDKKTVTKNGVLKVRWVTDPSAAQNPSAFRIVIDSASLTVK